MDIKNLDDVLESTSDLPESKFTHIEHMYTGYLSGYYYKRFRQALSSTSIRSSDDILVVGGGTGVFCLSLIQHVDQIFFSDISREDPLFKTPQILFDRASINENKIRFTVASATDLPYRSESFDAVFVLDVLEHIPAENEAISEISRVTRTGGEVIVSAPIEVGLPLLIREFYRFVDGRRQNSTSVGELLRGVVGKPPERSVPGHHGYDYRQTVSQLQDHCSEVSVEYCPVPSLRVYNPTAIINGQI